MKRCSRCQRASLGRPSSPRGFPGSRFLSALGLRLYRCPQCGERSVRLAWARESEDADVGPVVALEAGRNGIPPKEEKLGFDELVRRIGRDEEGRERADES